METQKYEKNLFVVSLLLASLIFIVDVNIQLGVAGGVPYILLILISQWSPRPRFTLLMAILGSLLTITGFIVSPPGGELWKALANRFLALFAIWMTAILTLYRKQAEKEKTMQTKEALLSAEVGYAMATGSTLRAILQLCVESIVRNLDTAFARIWTVNWDENMLELQASAGMYTHIDGNHARIPVGKLKLGVIAKDKKPFLTNKAIDEIPGIDRDWAEQEKMVAFAGYPLIVDDKVIGVIGTFSKQPLFETTLKNLNSVATGIAIGIKRKREEEALRKTNQELQDSLAKVKLFSGLLPICANCKDIRDKENHWEKIENYISNHSEVQFSHSICLKCAKKLYPEFYHKNEDTGKQQSNGGYYNDDATKFDPDQMSKPDL